MIECVLGMLNGPRVGLTGTSDESACNLNVSFDGWLECEASFAQARAGGSAEMRWVLWRVSDGKVVCAKRPMDGKGDSGRACTSEPMKLETAVQTTDFADLRGCEGLARTRLCIRRVNSLASSAPL